MSFIFVIGLFLILTDDVQTQSSTTTLAPPLPATKAPSTTPVAPPLPGGPTSATTPPAPPGTSTPASPVQTTNTQSSAAPPLPVTNVTTSAPPITAQTAAPPLPFNTTVSLPPTPAPSSATTRASTILQSTTPGIADGTLRLVNGTTPSEGRLEVYHNGQWGTVCDDDFNAEEAAVACKQLGFHKPPYSARGKAVYGAGTGKIWLDDVVCNGNETSLTQCKHTTWAGGNCGHYEDVGLNCDSGNRIRLVNGWKYSEGRVEVYHNGEWGTVCGRYNFAADEADVICKSLGFVSGKAAPVPYRYNTPFGQGSGRVWLYNVDCTGNEGSFFDCQHVTWSASCSHYYDAGVDCTPGSIGNASEIRLYDGWKKSEGRVEVYHNGKRGTVCDDSFGATEASVVCKMLGYSGKGAVPHPGAHYGSGTGQIVLDDLDCQGNEASIFQCQHTTFGTSNCNHREDVGVDCEPGSQAGRINSTDLRLVGGSRPSEGRLEMFHNGEWGTICASSWDTREATVVCNMLGYNGAAAGARISAYYGQGSGRIWFDQVTCQGNETNLIDCPHRTGSSCRHSADVGVDCHPELDGNITTIRLVNGSRPSAGRVEVFHNGQWGTVCDHYFGREEATVICKMLGFPGPIYSSRIGANYGQGTGQIWLDNVVCVGNETNFFACQHRFWGRYSSCYHSRDAGVDCDPGLEGNASTIRLSGGWKKSEGRVEVLHNGQWGTVCDYNFGYTEARVLCQMLGFNGTSPSYKSRAYYGQGTGPEWLYNVDCTGSETNIFVCNHYGWGKRRCGHYHDVGVDCDPGRSAQSVNVSDFRLVNGTRPTEGRLELLHDGEWGSVCMTDWDAREAEVVCRMLNLSTNGIKVKARTGAYFGESQGRVWIDNIRCNGNEANLLDCYHSTWGRRSCDHRYDVGVDCAPGSEGNSSTIRLVNGARPSQGRLEVFHNGQWGTVCDDHFDIVDAQAACRTMGYSGNWVQAHGSFGEGNGRIWLDEVDCEYGDNDIFACDHEPWGRTDCAHGEDVGIDCKPDLDGNKTTIRLVNGSKAANGRLEVYHDGHWGTVCNHGWNAAATGIACKTLGYKGAFFTQSSNTYGQGNGTIWLDDFACQGNESSIYECQHGDWGHAACDHSDEVGIECDPDLNLRLVDGPDKYSGRVEVKVNGTWGTVCSYGFDSHESNVICRMLGNRRGGSVARSGTYGQGTGPIHLSYLGCRGNEYSIFQCSHRYYRYCRHSYDIGVNCQKGCLYDSDCDNNGTCLADHTCQCQRGWIGQYCDLYVGPSGDCRLPDACPRHSVCVPGNTSHIKCACVSGYEMKGLQCVDINECQKGHACPTLSTCHNTDGGYTCDCPSGYKHKGARCVDEDECQDTKACPPHTVCENSVGSYRCRCATGYKQDGLFCSDVDECQSALCPAGTQCTNTLGSFKCTCQQGYTLKGFLCQDINECQDAKLCPQQHSNCINSPGNYTCTCLNGFVMNTKTSGPSCDDLNECSGGSFTCPAHSHCVNEIGDYRCDCDPGYTEQNFLCRQITG